MIMQHRPELEYPAIELEIIRDGTDARYSLLVPELASPNTGRFRLIESSGIKKNSREKMYKIAKEYANRCNLCEAVKKH